MNFKKLQFGLKNIAIALILIFSILISVSKAESLQTPPSRNTCEGGALSLRFYKVIGATSRTYFDIWTPFVDIFERNSCLRRDIFSVLEKIDATASGMRSAIYTCDVKQFDQYTQEYLKAKMELFYLRNFGLTKKNFYSYHDLTDKVDLEKKLIQEFNGNINENDIKEAFSEFERYYNIDRYQKCQQSDLKLLKKKWKEFKTNLNIFKQVGTAWEEEASADRQNAEDRKRLDQMYPNTSGKADLNKGGALSRFGNWLYERVDAKIKAEDLKVDNLFSGKEWADAAEKAGGKLKKTFSDFLDYKKQTEEYFAERKEAIEAEAEIEVTFFEGSGVMADSFLCSLYELNKTIQNITEKTKEFKKCANIPLQRQCSNKKSPNAD